MPKIDLMQGDCLELMESIPDGSIDLVLTDPPYGTTACKWDTVIDFEPMWEQLKRIIKPNGAIALFGSEPFSSALRMSNIKQFKYDWVWKKSHPSNFVMAKKQPMRNHELVSIFYKKQCNYFFIKEPRECTPKSLNRWKYKKDKNASDGIGKNKIQGGIRAVGNSNIDPTLRYPTSIKFFENPKRNKLKHPTQKPVALLEYLIKTYTLEGETILDFTMGSGSTGVAAKNLNRNFIGIELDETYFKIASERINGYT